jgi:RNA polymerase sigma factor (sigma-70 family)
VAQPGGTYVNQPADPEPGSGDDADFDLDADFDEVYREYAPILVRTAYRFTGNTEDAVEAVQDVFERALRDWESRRRRRTQPISGYLHASLRHRLIDNYRRKTGSRSESGPVTMISDDILAERPDSRHSEDITVSGISVQMFWKAIVTTLSRREALTAWLRWDEHQQLTEQEIAQALGVSRATVRRDLEAARAAAVKQLAADSITPGTPGGEE